MIELERFRKSVLEALQEHLDLHGEDVGGWAADDEPDTVKGWTEVVTNADNFGKLMSCMSSLSHDVAYTVGLLLKAHHPDITDEQIGVIPTNFDT